MNWSTISNKEIGKCTILNYTIIIVLKNAMHYMCVSFKAIWSVKMNVKRLKNILIVNHNFVVTIGLPYCYLPLKLFLEQTISTNFVTYSTCSADLYAQKQRSQLLLVNDKALK